ncbi:MSS51 C-terminal domain-containing protein [Nannocystis pusilla]|uniref:Zinc finger MYND domain-containing protein n=1 Tax=Nannocystis pusilla TaxID=889268 RepID=A0ABS7U0E3_9BACT|nr:MSS51 C-terminal domain-containing protein [Nannocystis pusilla]MBZ5713992.1 zinc finger MYND domain-containing protein [Nannocystis pusilla]
MPRLLDYVGQCAELEKMARLEPRPAVEAASPGLAGPSADLACLVCGAGPARPCGYCRGVAYCGDEHRDRDARWHAPVCADLRAIADDLAFAAEHPRLADALLARAPSSAAVPTSWADYLGADLAASERRCMTDLATRPLTLAHVLTLLSEHVPKTSSEVCEIHIMAAARRERDVPPALWSEAGRLLGRRFALTLVGPELAPGDLGPGIRAVPGLYRRDLWQRLGRPALVIGYDCGLLLYPTWKQTMLELRGSGVPFVITSYRGWEAAGEARVLKAIGAVPLLAPALNPFASLSPRRSTTIANDVARDNAYLSAWR